MKELQVHNINPVFDSNSKILILGSFPSVKSREIEFFYGHPQNRFWQVLSAVCESLCPVTTAQKREFLLSNKIAVWDVIKSCEIVGSADSSIRDVTANDLSVILNSANIEAVFTNGGVSTKLYKKYCLPNTNMPSIQLPSTSPANARFSIDMLIEKWSIIKEFI